MNNSKQTNKGITLIALVITIIVLLILARVTINTLTGDNGILKQATTAKEITKKAEAEEAVDLLLNEWQARTRTEKISLKNFLQEKLTNNEIDNLSENIDGSYTVEKNGYVMLITAQGKRQEMTGATIAKVEPENTEDWEWDLENEAVSLKTGATYTQDGTTTLVVPNYYNGK